MLFGYIMVVLMVIKKPRLIFKTNKVFLAQIMQTNMSIKLATFLIRL